MSRSKRRPRSAPQHSVRGLGTIRGVGGRVPAVGFSVNLSFRSPSARPPHWSGSAKLGDMGALGQTGVTASVWSAVIAGRAGVDCGIGICRILNQGDQARSSSPRPVRGPCPSPNSDLRRIPKQVIIRTPSGAPGRLGLPCNSSEAVNAMSGAAGSWPTPCRPDSPPADHPGGVPARGSAARRLCENLKTTGTPPSWTNSLA